MNRKEFGKLIAALRKELRDAHGNLYTQAKLAEKAMLSEKGIGRLERGEKEKLAPEVLLNLADALKLTAQERKEFLLAASLVDEGQLDPAGPRPQKILDSLVSILEQLRTPAFIADCFGNLLYVNPLALAVYNLPATLLQDAPAQHPARFNFLRLLFAPEFEAQRSRVKATWEAFARQTILQFRVSSFRFQTHPYFCEVLLPALNQSPLFRQFWQAPRTEEEDLFTNFNRLSVDHPAWGQLEFVSSPLQAPTPFGDLMLITFHPLGLETTMACFQMAEATGTGAIWLTSWPAMKPGNNESVGGRENGTEQFAGDEHKTA